MSLAHAVVAKVAVGAAAAAVLAGAGAAVVVRQDQGPVHRPPAWTGGQALAPAASVATGDGEVVIDPGTGALRLLTAHEAARAGAGAGARTTGRPGSGAQAPAGAPAASVQAGGTAAAPRPPASLTGPVTQPSGDGGGAPSGSGGSNTPPGGSGGTGPSPGPSPDGGGGASPPPAAPRVPAVTAPAVPSSASTHSQGSFTVVVPGTAKVSKKLCLSGEVNRCQTVTVPALRPVELTVSYSGNAGVQAPTFTTAPCPGGLSVGVSGLTPGATISATVEGRRVSATVPTRGGQQSASLCDA